MVIVAILAFAFVLVGSLLMAYAVPALMAAVPNGISAVTDTHNRVISGPASDTSSQTGSDDAVDMSGLEKGTVTRIVDGDTLDVGNKRIRLSLVNTPERGEPGYHEATDFTAQHCRIGSTVFFDEDDGQSGGSYGRVIAMVWCGTDLSPGASLNAKLIESDNAELFPHFCWKSEFGKHTWAKKAGC